ncbi:sensor histidine kinase [Actinoplanes sp. RD1]|uniref:sensor histidine kinase n=1 Tax=Actinoplanes sp. RD1 TaxID=3064538 RepID=UPI0027427F3D|nr:histidine kinase [Actinoplanes sp. RD1]
MAGTRGATAPAATVPPGPGSDPSWASPAQRRLLDRRERLRGWGRRHPVLLDLAVVAGFLVLTLPNNISRLRPGDDGPGLQTPIEAHVLWPAVAALLVPLFWRRRAPAAAFAAFAVILLVEWSYDVWVSADAGLLIMLYSLAAHASLRVTAWAAAATAVLLTVAVYGLRDDDGNRLIGLLLVLGTSTAGLALGLTARTRRAYLAALVDRNARLETERDQRARLAVAAERAGIARDMHDVVGHHIAVIIGLADGGASLAASRGEQTAEPLRLIGGTGRQALGELRRVVGALRDDQGPQLRPQPGLGDVEQLLEPVRAAGLTVTYRTSGHLLDLSNGVQLAVYRIVQEALTNTLKHAGPGAAVRVRLSVTGREVHLRVDDDGRGTDRSSSDGPGHGLIGIRERAGLYDGRTEIGPAATGDGWVVDVVMTDQPVDGREGR